MRPKKFILPIIVVAQFCCTSLWFAGNGVMQDLTVAFGLGANDMSYLTSVVQLGFILGTLVFAVLSVADRFAPSKVFFYCAVLAAVGNLGVIWEGNQLSSLLVFRFVTGFFLAGIYPVGMKIAADYYQDGLGKSLGFLVGALVVGTAFPHLLKGFTGSIPWQGVLITTTALAVIGGLLMLTLVPNGPYRKASPKVQLSAFFKVFASPHFRSAAFGYFGHMWELYAFWAFAPILLQTYMNLHPSTSYNIPSLSFAIIAIGGLACVLGGYLSQQWGVKRIARLSLLLSGICCLLSPLLLAQGSSVLFIVFLLFWGMVVIADSPLFSTLVAQNAPLQLKGTALTIVNSIGFAITIISIQWLSALQQTMPSTAYLILAIGPILGLTALTMKAKILNA